jgi:hypothetical protein
MNKMSTKQTFSKLKFNDKADSSVVQIIAKINDPLINKETVVRSCGTLIKYKNKVCAIVNFDYVRFASEIHVNLISDKQPFTCNATIIKQNYDLGLSLLELNKKSIKDWCYIGNIFNLSQINSEHMNNDFPIEIFAIDYIFSKDSKTDITVHKIIIETKIESFILTKKYNTYSPQLPNYTFLIDNKKKSNLALLIGGTVMDGKHNLVGLISHCDLQEKIVCEFIPAMTIVRLLEGKSKLYGLPINFEKNNTTFDDIKIKYNHTSKKNTWEFKKNDVIIELDKTDLTKNSEIYLPVLKKYVPIDTYLAYCNEDKKQYLNITIMRKNKIHKLKLKHKTLNSMYRIAIYNEINYFVNLFELVFVELTFEIIIRLSSMIYKQLNKQLNCKALNELDNMCNNNKYAQKYILLLRIKSGEIKNSTTLPMISEPIIGLVNKGNVEILLLKSIENTQIKNIYDLERLKPKLKNCNDSVVLNFHNNSSLIIDQSKTYIEFTKQFL